MEKNIDFNLLRKRREQVLEIRKALELHSEQQIGLAYFEKIGSQYYPVLAFFPVSGQDEAAQEREILPNGRQPHQHTLRFPTARTGRHPCNRSSSTAYSQNCIKRNNRKVFYTFRLHTAHQFSVKNIPKNRGRFLGNQFFLPGIFLRHFSLCSLKPVPFR